MQIAGAATDNIAALKDATKIAGSLDIVGTALINLNGLSNLSFIGKTMDRFRFNVTFFLMRYVNHPAYRR